MLVEELFEQTLIDAVTDSLSLDGFMVTNVPLRPAESDSEKVVFIDLSRVSYEPKSMESWFEYWAELEINIGILCREKTEAYSASIKIFDSIHSIIQTDTRYKKVDIDSVKNSVETGGNRSFYMKNMTLMLKYVEDYSNG